MTGSSAGMWRHCQGCSLAGRVEEKAGAVGQTWKMIKTRTGGDM